MYIGIRIHIYIYIYIYIYIAWIRLDAKYFMDSHHVVIIPIMDYLQSWIILKLQPFQT